MAEGQQSAKRVEMNKAFAAGIASVVVAVFTSKLGVAGTLIGTALTAMAITLISAILQAQIQRAQTKLSGLPSTVRGRLSTQQVRIPGRPNAEPDPEPPPPPEPRGGSSASFLERLRSIPSYLRGLSPSARRRVLLSGLLAGLLATAIGLVSVTGIELAGGRTLTCMVWGCPAEAASGGGGGGSGGGSGTSLTRAFGGGDAPTTDAPNAPRQNAPAGGDQYQQPAGQPGVQPQQGNPARPAEPTPQAVPDQQQQPGGTPQYDAPAQPQRPGGAGQEEEPGAGGNEEPAPVPGQ